MSKLLVRRLADDHLHPAHYQKARRIAGTNKSLWRDLRRTAIATAFQQNMPATSILNTSNHESAEMPIRCNKESGTLENDIAHSLDRDSE